MATALWMMAATALKLIAPDNARLNRCGSSSRTKRTRYPPSRTNASEFQCGEPSVPILSPLAAASSIKKQWYNALRIDNQPKRPRNAIKIRIGRYSSRDYFGTLLGTVDLFRIRTPLDTLAQPLLLGFSPARQNGSSKRSASFGSEGVYSMSTPSSSSDSGGEGGVDDFGSQMRH